MTGLDRWQEAAERLTAYVQIRSTARGLDNELLHAYNYVELRMSDLSALLGVVDRQARQLAAVEKCIADMRLAADLARSFVRAGEPSFVAEAIHQACNNVAAALAGGETNDV